MVKENSTTAPMMKNIPRTDSKMGAESLFGFINSSTSAPPWIACKGTLIQDLPHGKPSMAASAMGLCVLCKEPLPAPGNRSNERRYKEKDLARTGKKGRNGGRERAVAKKSGL
ncbi:hypothetical protein TNCV_679551 [Trichonephila clavipes]|nr:hypothetical protein TNCV_679551 [Trichonephila clavipes]